MVVDVDAAGPARRPYDASGRRAAAEQRRAHVAETAARMFADAGWSGTTLAAVAREAGVSPELVSKTFGGKAALFIAGLRAASFGDRAGLVRAFPALRLEDEPDLEVRLDRVVDFVWSSLSAMAPLVPVMLVGADQDDGLRAIREAARAGHVDTCRDVVRLLAPGPEPADALETVCLLTRAETYLLMVEECGWSRERYQAWLRRSLVDAVRPVA